jgi:hypothetical protein
VRTESALNLSRLGKQERQKPEREQSLEHPRAFSLAVEPPGCKVLLLTKGRQVRFWSERTNNHVVVNVSNFARERPREHQPSLLAAPEEVG